MAVDEPTASQGTATPSEQPASCSGEFAGQGARIIPESLADCPQKTAELQPPTEQSNLLHFVRKEPEGTYVKLPLDTLSSAYYFGLRPLLHTPNADDKDLISSTSEDEHPIRSREIEEMEKLLPSEAEEDVERAPERLRGKKKPKKKKPAFKDAEYDFDDPFIDDTDAARTYVSIFDLMAGRIDKNEFGTMEIAKDESTTESGAEDEFADYEKKPPTAAVIIDRAEDFFVYQGPMIEKVEKEFEEPKKRKRTSPSKSKGAGKLAPKKNAHEKKADASEKSVPVKPPKSKKSSMNDSNGKRFQREDGSIASRIISLVDALDAEPQGKPESLSKEGKAKSVQIEIAKPKKTKKKGVKEQTLASASASPRVSPDKQRRFYDVERVRTHTSLYR